MVTFIFGIGSLVIYYVLLLSWIFLFPRIADKISDAMPWMVNLAVLINLLMGGIAMIFGFVKMAKGIRNAKDRFLNKIGVTCGIFTIIIWCFLFLAFLWQALMNWACRTLYPEEIKLFKITLIILSIAPIILSIVFLIQFIKMHKHCTDETMKLKTLGKNEKK